MLSGSVPFQVAGPDKASKIMDRIKGGRFSFKGAVWNVVSESAKDIIKGKWMMVNSVMSSLLPFRRLFLVLNFFGLFYVENSAQSLGLVVRTLGL